MRDYCPLVLDLRKKKCLVVRGGNVALRKVKTLLVCGACICIVSPTLCGGLQEIVENGEVLYEGINYQSSLLDNVFLVVSSTDDSELNREVAKDCFSRNILVNTSDDLSLCSFFFPSVVSRGPLSVAVSTEGRSPAFARLVREQLEELFSDDSGDFLEFLGGIRPRVVQSVSDPRKRKELFLRLAGREVYDHFRNLTGEDLDKRVLELIDQYRDPEDFK
ncbi:MAG: bifunctional precorrin-2 dehydrogenase/sirohydrochlorin ferrochelatase [Bacillota bacterium]|nr:bifunctional precorrin-2 dehydrogenase/sirohydrochlorin ferrochelatase [Bacillota bacterium]